MEEMGTTLNEKPAEMVALNADVVGYSRLLADDLEATTATMEEYKELVEGRVARTGGRSSTSSVTISWRSSAMPRMPCGLLSLLPPRSNPRTRPAPLRVRRAFAWALTRVPLPSLTIGILVMP